VDHRFITASAPTRIDLAGGTLDIWPLYLFHEHAQTVNAAISLRAHAEITPRTDGRLKIESIDTGATVEVSSWRSLASSRELPLLSRLASFFRAESLTLRTRGESPAGAGIGGSSALNIAVCGALARWSGAELDGDALLTIAMNVEAQVIKVPTGVQDYRPAYYGGVAALELRPDGIKRVPIDIDFRALERRLVLVYTGAPHFSGTNNWEITKRHIDGDRHVFDCFEQIVAAASALRAALVRQDWTGVAQHLAAEWSARIQLAPGVTTPVIDDLIAAAKAAGAGAAKVCGAGGGGCLFCLADPEDVPAVREALSSRGARLLDYRIETDGLQVTASRSAESTGPSG
jgi:D-glycero-alpha-D-manno-heptose-7-phosphate kinase